MSRSKLVISIIIILSIAVGVLAGFYFYTKKSTTQTPTINPTDRTIFGGTGGVRTDLPPDNTNNVTNPDQTEIIIDRPNSTSTPKANPLRMIAVGPISGADFVIRDIIAISSLASSSSQNIGNQSTTTATSSKKVTKPVVTKIVKPKILGQEEKIRYIERGTGRIYETATSTTENVRISNSTYTKIYESFFDKKGDNVLMRGLLEGSDVIQTRFGTLFLEAPTSTSMSLKTKDLVNNLISVVVSPEKDYFASYIEQKGVGSSVNISRLDGTGVFNIYKSPFREWLLSWI